MSLWDEDMVRGMTPGQGVGRTGAKWGQAGHDKGKNSIRIGQSQPRPLQQAALLGIWILEMRGGGGGAKR